MLRRFVVGWRRALVLGWLRVDVRFVGLVCAALMPVSACSSDTAPLSAEEELGKELYEQRCASCHEDASGRTPSREVLSKNTPAFILNAMNGAMAPMAEGLSDVEKKAIALYVSSRDKSGGDGPLSARTIWGPSSAQMPLDGPRCEGGIEPVNMYAADQWIGWSPSKTNDRYQRNPGLAKADVPRLKVKWAFKYPGSKNGQATVVGDRVFVTSMSGAVYALNAETGCVYWRHDALAPTRSSVSLKSMPPGGKAKTALYYSDWTQSAVAIDADTGDEIWRTQIEDETGTQMTGSPTLWKDILLVPISSGNEAFAASDAYICCKFVGSLVALNANTGEILWKRYTTDEKSKPYRKNAKGQQMWGPGGGSIWSAPTVDAARGRVYVSTSNSHTDKFHDGANAVIAIDLETGDVIWKNQVWPDDNYIINCPKSANCPKKVGPDFALGASPILHTQKDGRQLLLAGQKSGILWALDPVDGQLVWKTRLSPGSTLGGIQFGPAADEDKVYVGISDVAVFPQERAKSGLYALNISDGAVVWSKKSLPDKCRWTSFYCSPAISQAVTVIPGVVFAGAMNGWFRAHDTDSGDVLWEFNTAATPITTVLGKKVVGGVMDAAGPTVVGGTVFVHSGYGGREGSSPYGDTRGAEGNLLIAFSVDGE